LATPVYDAGPPSGRTVQALDFATLTVAEARVRQGQRVRVRVVCDGILLKRSDGRSIHVCKSADDSLRLVAVRQDARAREELGVTGILKVSWVPIPHGPGEPAGAWCLDPADTGLAR